MSKGLMGTVTGTDVLRVAVEGGVVKYRKNGTLLYTSTVTPTYPLLVDTSLYSNGSTITNVVISSGSGGGGSSNANINWLVTDQLGTPRMIFDKTGTLANVKRHDYLPFGKNSLRAQVAGHPRKATRATASARSSPAKNAIMKRDWITSAPDTTRPLKGGSHLPMNFLEVQMSSSRKPRRVIRLSMLTLPIHSL